MNKTILFNNYTGEAASSTGVTITTNDNTAIAVSGTLAGTVVIEMLAEGGWTPIAGGTFSAIECRLMGGIRKSLQIRARATATQAGLFVEVIS